MAAKTNKTFRLDPGLLREVKRHLGFKTVTQAIEETLRAAVSQARHKRLLTKYAGKVCFENFPFR